MKMLLKTLSWLAMAVTVLIPILFLNGNMELDRVKMVMTLATAAWFATAPFWMKRAE